VGQELCIDLDMSHKKRQYVTYSRPILEPHEITNYIAVVEEMFIQVENDDSLTDIEKSEKILALFAKWVSVTMPQEAKIKEICMYQPCLRYDTMEVRRTMHKLREWYNDVSGEEKRKVGVALAGVKKKWSNLKRRDKIVAMMEIFDHTFNTQKQLWRVHSKLNKNKIKTEVPGDAETVANEIEKLQFANGENALSNLPLLDNTNLSPNKKFSFGEISYDAGAVDVAICEKIFTSKPFTSGHSGLNRRIVQNFPMSMLKQLSFPVKTSMKQGTYFRAWSCNRMIALRKPNGKVRPITIADFSANLTEKIVGAKFLKFLQAFKILYKHQHAFRGLYSCGTAIAEMMHRINTKNKRDFALAIFADMKNAFGYVSHDRLLQKLKGYCNDREMKWFTEYLRDREFELEHKGQTATRKKLPKNTGTPQGGAPSAILWSFYINDMHYVMLDNTFLLLFADDVQLIIRGANLQQVSSDANEQIDILEKYLIDNGQVFAPEKTFMVSFSKSEEKPRVEHKGKKIALKTEFKYLGVHFGVAKGRFEFKGHYGIMRQRFRKAQRMAFSLSDMGYKHQLANNFRSIAAGVYLHASDALPIPPAAQLQPLQTIYNATIIELFKEMFFGIENISQIDILLLVGHPSLYNMHVKQLLNRASQILMHREPEMLYDALSETLFFGDEKGNFICDYVDRFKELREAKLVSEKLQMQEKVLQKIIPVDYTNFNEYQIGLNWNRYYLWMKYPKNLLKKCGKMALKQTFPYNTIELFNREPASVRSQIGTYGFKASFKQYTDMKCHHKYKSKKTRFCKFCKPNGIIMQQLTGDYEDFGNEIIPNDMENIICHKLHVELRNMDNRAIKSISALNNFLDQKVANIFDTFEQDQCTSHYLAI